MGDCCSPEGYRQIFSERSARTDARRYQRRGLDRTSARIVALLREQDVRGLTLLDVGAGIGAVELELLRDGLTWAVGVELTPTYEEVAATLLAAAGLQDRVERRVMDFAEAGADVPAADIVVMNRVVCCYPDMPRLAGAAADHARRLLVMSFPNGYWWTRLGLAVINLALCVTRRQFRVFLHPPDQIVATAERHGLRTRLTKHGRVWQVVAFERAAGLTPAAGA